MHPPDLEMSTSMSVNHRASEGERPPKLAYSIVEFAGATGLSRSLIYEAIKLGELQSVKIRARRLILFDDGHKWLRSFREN
jgi:excisionase family DNA binding protein